jgi:hypothetical protein
MHLTAINLSLPREAPPSFRLDVSSCAFFLLERNEVKADGPAESADEPSAEMVPFLDCEEVLAVSPLF